MRCGTERIGGVIKPASPGVSVRHAVAADCGAVGRIYSHNVLTGTATFETMAPDQGEMARRLAKIQDAGLPYLVAEMAGALVGFAYASPYNPRHAYRFTLGNSVYVAENAQGRGIGRALMTDLLAQCAALHYRQMIAVVDDGNAASLRLHEAVGFSRVGMLRGAGYKFGRWVDVALLQCALGPGDGAAPEDPDAK